MKSNNIYRNQGIVILIFFICILFLTIKLVSIIIPFILGFVFAYILDPIIKYCAEEKKLNKKLSILVILITFFTMFFLILYYLIPGVINQANGLIIKLNVKEYFSKDIGIEEVIKSLSHEYPIIGNLIESSLDTIYAFFFKLSNHLFTNIIQSGKVILSLATILLLTPILTFYFALDMQKIIDALKKLIPISYKNDVLKLFKDINNTIAKYLRGQLSVSIIIGIYYTVSLFLLSVDYALVLGIFSGFSLFIPYLGIIFSFILTSIIAYSHLKTWSILIYVVIVYVLGSIIEGIFITPKLMGKSLNLHPLWIFLGVFVGGSLLGFLGILFTIPLTAIIAVIIRFFIKAYKKSKLYKY